MNESDFKAYVKWANKRGIKLNPHLERRSVDGVFGMYSTAKIAKNDILVATAKKQKNPKVRGFIYPDGIDPNLKTLHAYAIEHSLGEKSEFSLYFKTFTGWDVLKKHSAYFFSAAEVEQVKSLSPLLHSRVIDFNSRCRRFIDYLCQIDSTVPRASVEVVILNYVARAFRNFGFLPLFDMFNHSDNQGRSIDEGSNVVSFKAGRHYEPGEQVWINYGRKDMYDHALDYGYFDPRGTHFIDVTSRIAQAVNTDFARRVVARAAKILPIKCEERQGTLFYSLAAPGSFIEEDKPGEMVCRFVRNTCYQSEKEMLSGECTQESFKKGMIQLLDGMMGYNKVDELMPSEVPEKLHYLYEMLKKEKTMMLANLDWANKL